jgi:hypothetical protein
VKGVLVRLRMQWSHVTVALGGVLALAWLGLSGFAWNDYETEAAPALKALAGGDVAGFLAQAPAYGGSLILRAPFTLATSWLGGGELAVFRAVSIPCLVAVAILALVLADRMLRAGSSRGACLLVVALAACNPVTLRALEVGHPEELLCAALAIGAVLAATRERTLPAAVLLGLAIASKAWAVLAIGPVLLALPGRRLLALGVAGAVCALVVGPLLLGGTGGSVVHGARQTGGIFNPWQVWWPLGEVTNVGFDGTLHAGARAAPQWLQQLTHPLIALLVVPLSLLYRRRNVPGARDSPAEQTLGLLALLLLLRCMLDPWNTSYYELPFLLALLSWEALCRRSRPPVLTLGATVAVWVTFVSLRDADPDLLCAAMLAWSLPLAGWLARELFVPGLTLPRTRRARRVPDYCSAPTA